MNTPFPVVRLTLEHMQYEIVSAVSTHLDEMKDTIKSEVAAAIQRFDFTGAVREIAYRAIQSELETAVKHAIANSVWTQEVRDALQQTAADQIVRLLKQ